MLSEENINKIVWGGIYKCKVSNPCHNYNDRLNDQKYYIWIPVCDDIEDTSGIKRKEYGMVDTYQVPIGVSFTDKGVPENLKGIERLVFKLTRLENPEYGGYVKRKTWDYYYRAYVKLTDNNFNDFELLGDLHDYETTKNAEHYDDENVLTSIKLYQGHAYPYGINLVRKGADINIKNKINNIIYENEWWVHEPRPVQNYVLEELKELEKRAIKENKEYDKDRLEKYYKLNQKLKELEKEYNDYKKTLYEKVD